MTTDEAAKTGPAEMTPEAVSRFWQVQLHLSELECKDWWQEADAIIERYKAGKSAVAKVKSQRRVNILYSNTETLRAAVYAKPAKPDVRQRFASKNPVASQGAEVLERALTYTVDTIAHDAAMKATVRDTLLPGAGVAWVEYEPRMTQQMVADPMTGLLMPQEVIADQKLRDVHIYFKDFLWSPARAWPDVWWIARRLRMTRDDLKANGFADADTVPLNWSPNTGDNKKDAPDEVRRAEVFEIWDKSRRQRVYIVKGHPKALRVDPDPLGLEDFWPTPGLLVFGDTNESLIPVPEFRLYADLADDLDETQSRISVLTKALKRRGVRDASIEELSRLAKAQDNEFIPVKNFQQFAQKGGLDGAFQTEDIKVLGEVLIGLYQAQDMLESKIDKLTGVADIMRGEGDSGETATQSRIKAQFGGLRLKDRQKTVQSYLKALTRIKAELIAEHFEPHVLMSMTQIEIGDEVMQMLRDDKLRCYAVDIETDSTVFEDSEGEKEARVEVTGAVTSLLQQSLPMMQAAPEMGELIFESISLLLKTMKGGRALEDVVDRAREAMTQRMQMQMQQAQQPQSDPKLEVEQVKAEAAMQKAQADQQKTAMDMQISQMEFGQRMQEAAFMDQVDERRAGRKTLQ